MRVLGIESSCDETGLAIYDDQRGLLADALHSQIELHRDYGGVVPELAARDHLRRLVPMAREVLRRAALGAEDLDGIAYTAGPGLVGALLSGAAYAHALGFALGRPVIGVHHLEAHLLAPLLDAPNLAPPFVALLVSGGHTLLAAVEQIGQYRLLGETLDDSAGELLDKVAKLLGLGYPGGPAIEALAGAGRPGVVRLSRPMLDRPGYDFSFSGLKTQALQAARGAANDRQAQADLALELQTSVIDVLVTKARRALSETGFQTLVVAGGVSANRSLRAACATLERSQRVAVHFPRLAFCTDNGAMVALAGAIRLRAARATGLAITARARWPLDELEALPR